jgi:hypothetical protein
MTYLNQKMKKMSQLKQNMKMPIKPKVWKIKFNQKYENAIIEPENR